jgi:NRAMP (natural resistance-associated macrophage protein)-like metal ion transporter
VLFIGYVWGVLLWNKRNHKVQAVIMSNNLLNELSDATKALEYDIEHSEKIALNLAKHSVNKKRFNGFLRVLGPGLITGAADDDPSGIATYSQAGAGFGYSLLWVFPLLYPMLLVVQESCARIGAVTGKGLAAVIKEHYSRKLLYASVFLVIIANTINIAADLGAMAAATRLLIPLPYILLAVLFALAIILLEVFVSYKAYARTLKWLAIVLFAYPITAFLVGEPWLQILKATFIPHINIDFTTIYILVGIIGTTVSPYLFFWDTAETAENEIISQRATLKGLRKPNITKHFLHGLRVDNLVGMTLTIVTAFFIVITCASVLNASGVTQINTAADAARALEPLVHNFPQAGLIAKLLFSVGIIGIGLLAVPVLAGSSAYAFCEAAGWKEGLHRRFKQAHAFYAVIALSTIVGLLMNFLGIDPIKALIFAAVFNSISSVPLLFMIARIGNDKNVMGEFRNGKLANSLIRLTFIIILSAVLILFYAMLAGKLH